MIKKHSTLNELAFNIADFFDVTNTKNNTNTYIEKSLKTHKKAAGKNIVLLVSNGLTPDQESNKQEVISRPDFRIIDKGMLVDKQVLALGHDRSQQIYQDTANCINQSLAIRNNTLAPVARFFSGYESDQELLSRVCSHLHKSIYPSFNVACLNSSFLTPSGHFTKNIQPIAHFIEESNLTHTIFLLTSKHQLASEKSATDQVLQPLVPLIIAAELLRHYKSRDVLHEVKESDQEKTNQKDEKIIKQHFQEVIAQRWLEHKRSQGLSR